MKARAETYLAPSLQGRLAYHATQYRHSHDQEGRCWIALDGVQLIDMSTLRAWAEQHRRAARACGRPEDAAWLDWESLEGDSIYWEQWREAERPRQEDGIFSEWDFRDALEEYLQLSIDEALSSGNPLHRALAMVDRRLGRRRFVRLAGPDVAHPLVRVLCNVRCAAEGWPARE